MEAPIGIFDSGYGGLTVMKEIVARLPQYNYIYLGDNARAPYGPRSFETVYQYTLEAVKWFFEKGCPLVVLACNTASAKALRTIQQKDLPVLAPHKRVLGVIRPVTESMGNFTKSRHVGILGTNGTISSQSYPIEITKFFPDIEVSQQACPMWVPLVENGEFNSPGADYFVKRDLEKLFNANPLIDTIILGCTHYPLLIEKIKQYVPNGITIVSQAEIVADSFSNYLLRHPEIEVLLAKNSQQHFFTTESPEIFNAPASIFFGSKINAVRTSI